MVCSRIELLYELFCGALWDIFSVFPKILCRSILSPSAQQPEALPALHAPHFCPLQPLPEHGSAQGDELFLLVAALLMQQDAVESILAAACSPQKVEVAVLGKEIMPARC